MPYFAVMSGNFVSNVIIADTKDTALAVSPKGSTVVQYVDEHDAGIGWTYDGTTFTEPIKE